MARQRSYHRKKRYSKHHKSPRQSQAPPDAESNDSESSHASGGSPMNVDTTARQEAISNSSVDTDSESGTSGSSESDSKSDTPSFSDSDSELESTQDKDFETVDEYSESNNLSIEWLYEKLRQDHDMHDAADLYALRK